MTKFDDEFDAIQQAYKNNPTDEEREELKKRFFANAVAQFNEEIAGDLTLADGRTITIHEI
jgi:hypothetical protein